MTKLVLSAIGDDRAGLVSALSRVVDSHGGNWLDSQFARLGGKFAGLVLIELDADRSDELESAVADLLREVGWKIEVTRAETGIAAGEDSAAEGAALIGAAEESAYRAEPLRVHLIGTDRPGMVRQITGALADQGISISTFRSWTSAAPMDGGVLFEAEALVRLPAGADEEAVREALEPIADELMIDLELGGRLHGRGEAETGEQA